MSNTQNLKTMAYDHPDFTVRKTWSSIMTAGSGGVSGKFPAHASALLYGLHAYTTIAGTSTYTQTQYFNNWVFDTSTGTIRSYTNTSTSQTVHANATQLSVIRITNTATFGAAPALSTTTIGPFTVSVPYANGTATGGIGAYAYFAINTSTGTGGIGGVQISQGDQVFVVNGTDATHVALVELEYQDAQSANVLA